MTYEKHRIYFRYRSRRKKYVLHVIIVTTILFITLLFVSQVLNFQSDYFRVNKRSNELEEEGLKDVNCTPSAVESFPNGFFTKEQRLSGAVTINFLVAFYIFGAIAVICDDYFVPSLEGITEGLNLAPDVAGATFMAAGSSAPELFTSIIGVFITKGEIGLGTILGSAVFNLLFIIGLCGLLAGMVIQLLFWPMFRDSLYYLISISALVIALYDSSIHWYEGFIFLLLYTGYIVIMYFNESLENFVNRFFNINRTEDISERTLLTEDCEKNGIQLQNGKRTKLVNGEAETSNGVSVVHSYLNESHNSNENGTVVVKTTEDSLDDVEHVLAVPEGLICRCVWVIALPIYLAFYITVPDCRRQRWKSWFMITFLISVIYIGALSYVLVWMVSIIGDTFGIDDSMMGLTLLAAGTSIPDAMASVMAARDGYGGMAISNSIGSNIFDILLCLGLPWFIQTLFVDFNGTFEVHSASLLFTTIMLLATVFVTAILFYLQRGKLNKCTGAMFIVAYLVFITVCILNDLDFFGSGSSIVTCPT